MPAAVGATPLVGMRVGVSEVSAAYVGTEQVWSSAPPPFGPLSIPWEVAIWAEDPASSTGDGQRPATWNQPGLASLSEWKAEPGGYQTPIWQAAGLGGRPCFYTQPTWSGNPYCYFRADYSAGAPYSGPVGGAIIIQDDGQPSNGGQVQYPGFVQDAEYWGARLGSATLWLYESPMQAAPQLFCWYWPPAEGTAYLRQNGAQVATRPSPADMSVGGSSTYLYGQRSSASVSQASKIAFFGWLKRELSAQEQADLLAWAREHYSVP